MNLERAIEIAVSAHKGQLDKGGSPYILHPLSVMMALNSEDEKIVGVLHDVVEDNEAWTFERLEIEGFSISVIEALKSVTKLSENEDYDDFITRCIGNDIGRKVKIADLRHNLDATRIDKIGERDIDRLNKYKRAHARILEEV
jgi:(p)ppGpp synthase/HD superfamily hydrolase